MVKSKRNSKKSYKGRRTVNKKTSKKRSSRKRTSKKSNKLDSSEINDMKSILDSDMSQNQSMTQNQHMGQQSQFLSPSNIDPLMVNQSVPAQQHGYNFNSPVNSQPNIGNLLMSPSQLGQMNNMSPSFTEMVSPQSVVSPSHQKLQHYGYPQPQQQPNIANLLASPTSLGMNQMAPNPNISNLLMSPQQLQQSAPQMETMEVNLKN